MRKENAIRGKKLCDLIEGADNLAAWIEGYLNGRHRGRLIKLQLEGGYGLEGEECDVDDLMLEKILDAIKIRVDELETELALL